jgi:large subunit ribosomal protein L3
MRHVREFRVREADELEEFEVGQELDVSQFSAGQHVDVTGTSKGRGFSGVMRRHNFGGQKATHGTHESFRGGGAIGMSADPSRVLPGMKMPGQLGNKRTTIQNLEVIRVDEEDQLLLIKGGLPGAKNSLVEIAHAVKKARQAAFGIDY